MSHHVDPTDYDPAGRGPRQVPRARREPSPGDHIDRYVIREEVGRGGFGVVYRAEQVEGVRRPVALKLILIGMDTREVIARFEAERQVLAMMRHPGLAGVLDAGVTPDGRPYFVMEYIPGRTIDGWAAQERASLRQRVELLEQICRAIQHAHHRGVVHRDIKASNVLVQETEHGPRAVVIDFGVAKALHATAADHANLTRRGQPIGTLHAMAPEQLAGDVDATDTRSDIYAIGVLGYQLLTGGPPIAPSATGEPRGDAMARLQSQTPAPPHGRIRPGDPESERFARSAGVDAGALRRWLRGDVRHVIMQCLERQRDDRYESAAMLERDLRRVRRGEPVLAGPPSPWRRGRRFLHRHRVAAAVTAVVVASSIIAAGTLLRSNRSLRHQRGVSAMVNAGFAVDRGDSAALEEALAELPDGRDWRFHASLARAQVPARAGHAVLGTSGMLLTDITPPMDGPGFAVVARDLARGRGNVAAATRLIRVRPTRPDAADPSWPVESVALGALAADVRIAPLGSGRILCVDRTGRAVLVRPDGSVRQLDDFFARLGLTGDRAVRIRRVVPAGTGVIVHVDLGSGQGAVVRWLDPAGSKPAVTPALGVEAPALETGPPAIITVLPTGDPSSPAALVLLADGRAVRVAGANSARVMPGRWSDRSAVTRIHTLRVDRDVAVDPSGRWLVIGDEHGLLERFDLTDPNADGPVQRWRPHSGPVTAVRQLDDGARVISGGQDGRIVEWRRGVATAREIGRTEAAVVAITTTDSADLVVAVDADGVASGWTLAGLMEGRGEALQLVAGADAVVFVSRSGPDAPPRLQRWPRGLRGEAPDPAADRSSGLLDLSAQLDGLVPKAIVVGSDGDEATVVGRAETIDGRAVLPVASVDLRRGVVTARGHLPIHGGRIPDLVVALSGDGRTLVVVGRTESTAGPDQVPSSQPDAGTPAGGAADGAAAAAPIVSDAWIRLNRDGERWTPDAHGWRRAGERVYDVACDAEGRVVALGGEVHVQLERLTASGPNVTRVPTTRALALDFSHDGRWLAVLIERLGRPGRAEPHHEGRALMIDVQRGTIDWWADATVVRRPVGVLCDAAGSRMVIAAHDGLQVRTRSAGSLTLRRGTDFSAIAADADDRTLFVAGRVPTSRRSGMDGSRIATRDARAEPPVDIRAYSIDP